MLNEYDRRLELWKKANANGYQGKIASSKKLRHQSKEMIAALKELGLPLPGSFIFEIGCGSGRNLIYVRKSVPTAKIAGNDLVRKDCFSNMHPLVSEVIDFREMDTLSLFRTEVFHPDLLISSDHLMHISPDAAQEILQRMADSWKPQFIAFRERTVERKVEPAIFVHDYSVIEKHYVNILERKSQYDYTYSIRIFERQG